MKLFISLLLACIAWAQSSPQCYDYVLISTRGTGEPQGSSIAFPGMINSTLTHFPNSIEYDTNYPAGSGTEQLGANDIVRYIEEGIRSCPKQKYVLLGYSQGAAATSIALRNYTEINSAGYQATEAVITVGNPAQRANESAVVDQFGGSSTRVYQGILFNEQAAVPQTWYDSGKLKEFCYTNDLVCVGGQHDAVVDNMASHHRYGNTTSVQDIAADFIADRLRARDDAEPISVDEEKFPAVQEFKRIMSVVGTLGLRTPASPRQNILIDWILDHLSSVPGLQLSTQKSNIVKWQTMEDRSLRDSASLSIQYGNGTNISLPIIGAMPWSRPTNGSCISSEMVYIPQGVNLTTTNITGKIVVRDFGPTSSLPYSLVFFPQLYRTNDTDALLNTSYDRPYTGPPNRDMIDAGLAGAVGYISMFNVSGDTLDAYFDPHEGTHYRLPGLYVGSEAADVLRKAANSSIKATMSLDATVSNATQRQITARLPGRTNDTVYIVCHTDGNTYVQDNGVSALLSLAEYFGTFDRDSRNKTLAFVFTTGHLGYAADSTVSLAAQLDATYDTDDTVLAIALEHMGTREILPIGSPSGKANGMPLEFSGESELMVWCVGPSDALRNISISAAKNHKLDRVLVTQGASIPNQQYAPEYASFGGIGTGFHQHLIPTTSIISGPWSLWAPSFGSSAIDFDRLRQQTLAFAQVIVAVDGLSKAEIAGGYLDERAARRNGTKMAAIDLPPSIYAPGPILES